MTLILIYLFISFVLFSLFLTLSHFKKEMEKKMMWGDYVKDAIDGVYNDFNSNNNYLFEHTKGLAFYKNNDGSISIKSQSSLAGNSIKH